MPAARAAVTLPARLAPIIDGLGRAVAARLDRPGRPGLQGVLILLIWTRLRGILANVTALAGRIAAGRHRRIAVRRAPRPAPRRPPRRTLPHGRAWLVRLVPAAAAGAGQLQHLLADPDMAALLRAAPQMRRLLRPLGHMLGVRLPPPRPEDDPDDPVDPAPRLGPEPAQPPAAPAGGIAAAPVPPRFPGTPPAVAPPAVAPPPPHPRPRAVGPPPPG
jgi:hypothetical protein